MTGGSYDLAVFGGGQSADLIAIVAASEGRRVLRLQPTVDPDQLPRPLPPRADIRWMELLRVAGLEQVASNHLLQFGGAVPEPLSRRAVADSAYTETLTAEGGRWRSRSALPVWAWSEPADVCDWHTALREEARAAQVDYRPVSGIPQVSAGWLRRGRIVGVPPARRSLILLPASNATWVQGLFAGLPLPRCGIETTVRWWVDAARTVLWWSGEINLDLWPPGFGTVFAGTAAAAKVRPWELAGGLGLRVQQVPAPMQTTPAEWSIWLLEQIRWATQGRTVVGKSQ